MPWIAGPWSAAEPAETSLFGHASGSRKAAERYKRILIEWNGPENPSSVGLKAFLEHGLELKLIADHDPDRAVLYSVAR